MKPSWLLLVSTLLLTGCPDLPELSEESIGDYTAALVERDYPLGPLTLRGTWPLTLGSIDLDEDVELGAIKSAGVSDTGRLAVVDWRGRLSLTDALNGPFRTTNVDGALAAAWGPGSNLIAVLRGAASDPAITQVVVYTVGAAAELSPPDVRAQITLPVGVDHAILSWSPKLDELLISAPTTPSASTVAGPCYCLLVNLVTGAVQEQRWKSAFFVGQNQIVATVPDAFDDTCKYDRYRVRLIERQQGEFIIQERVPEAAFAVDSDPRSGVYFVMEDRTVSYFQRYGASLRRGLAKDPRELVLAFPGQRVVLVPVSALSAGDQAVD